MHTLLRGNPFTTAIAAALITVMVLMTAYLVSEPAVVNGQSTTTEEFTIRQEILGELAVTTPDNVIMDTALQGLTGGASFGTTSINVRTNNPTGYGMTIEFADTIAMQQEAGTGTIANYDPTSISNGDFTMSIGAGEAAFAYTASGAAGDMDGKFLSDGSTTCDSGSSSLAGTCWYGTADAQSAVTLVSRGSATAGDGATTTLNFQVQVSSGASVETGFYTATSTLTIFEN